MIGTKRSEELCNNAIPTYPLKQLRAQVHAHNEDLGAFAIGETPATELIFTSIFPTPGQFLFRARPRLQVTLEEAKMEELPGSEASPHGISQSSIPHSFSLIIPSPK
jgi:hypothetical protein